MGVRLSENDAEIPGTATIGTLAVTGGSPVARQVFRSSDAAGNGEWGDEVGYKHVVWTPKRLPASTVNGFTFTQPWSVVVQNFSPSEITSLNLQSTSLTSVTGLQYLTAVASLVFTNSSLTALDVSGLTALVTLDLANNLLTEGAVDAILAALDTNGASGGTVSLHGTGNAPPSAAGLVSKTNLEGRSWTVNVN